MTKIDKTKDGIIGPGPKAGIVLPTSGTSTPETSTVTVGAQLPKTKKKAGFKPAMRAKKTRTDG